jgi:protein TonB
MFEHGAIPGGSGRRFGVPMLVSLVLHGLAVAAVPAFTAFRPAPTATPESVFVVLNPRAPAAAAAVRSSPAARPPRPKRKAPARPVLAAPVAIPTTPAMVEPPPEQRPAPPLPPEELARPDGIPGGLGNAGGSAGAGVLATNAEGHVEYDDALMWPPERISGPDPEYTYLARVHDVQGVMVVKCLVTILGVVRDCRVLQGLPHMDGAVVEALLRRRYTPARLADGRAIEVEFTFRIRLQLVR